VCVFVTVCMFFALLFLCSDRVVFVDSVHSTASVLLLQRLALFFHVSPPLKSVLFSVVFVFCKHCHVDIAFFSSTFRIR